LLSKLGKFGSLRLFNITSLPLLHFSYKDGLGGLKSGHRPWIVNMFRSTFLVLTEQYLL